MEIVEIYNNWLYSICFDEDDLTEYHRVFREWHDLDYLVNFFMKNRDLINTDFWKRAGLNPNTPEKTAIRVIDEADNLEIYIKELVENCDKGCKPDFDEYFHFLGGKYKCLWSMEPVKSYGTKTPSLLRLYAIKIDSNCYLIVYGGIKLGDTIQNSPMLKDKVFNKIDSVLNFLKDNGIADSHDL
ncbi:MAG: hypothetical protein K2K94_04975 [Muribaculaceae bacterium]|nr:hypothetical protein [Muribaculaceae bacterium]